MHFNEFAAPPQTSRLYLIELRTRIPSHTHRAFAELQADLVVDRCEDMLLKGNLKIASLSERADSLIDPPALSESQKRELLNRQIVEEKAQVIRLLSSKSSTEIQQQPKRRNRRVLSLQKHKQFVKEIVQKKRELNDKQKERIKKQEQERQSSQKKLIKLQEQHRFLTLQQKRQQIKVNLQKLRENHEEFVKKQQQSRGTFHQLAKRKRLYQHLKDMFEARKAELQAEEVKRRQKQIKDNSKLDIQQILQNEQKYLQQKRKRKSKNHTEPIRQKVYKPPPHSPKISIILAEEEKYRNKTQIERQVAREKLQRTKNYTIMLKQINRPNFVVQTITTEKNQSEQGFHQKSNKQEFIMPEQIRRKRKRTKTQQIPNQDLRTIKPYSERIQIYKPNIYAHDIHLTSTNEPLQELQNVLTTRLARDEQIRRIKKLDDTLQVKLDRKQALRRKQRSEDEEQEISLLVDTVRAKLSLLNYYQEHS